MKKGTLVLLLLNAAILYGKENEIEDYSSQNMLSLWKERTLGINLAFGKKVYLSPDTNYLNSKEGIDSYDLTDGVIYDKVNQAIWKSHKSVQWRAAGKNKIIIDLEKEEVIGKIVWRILAGMPPSFTGPEYIKVYGSNDGEKGTLLAEKRKWSDDYAGENCYKLPVLKDSKDNYKTYVYPLEINLNDYMTRYVIIEFYQEKPSFCTSDELVVIKGKDSGRSMQGLPLEKLLISGIHLISPENKLPVIYGMYLPLFLKQIDMREDQGRSVKYCFKLPPGIELKSKYALQKEGDKFVVEMKEGGNTSTKKHIGPFFFIMEKPLSSETIVEFYAVDESGNKQKTQNLILYPETLPQVFNLKLLSTSIGWIYESEHELWPDFKKCYQKLGFNTIPVFPRTWLGSNPEEWDKFFNSENPSSLTEQGKMIQKFRTDGFKIIYMDSPLHVLNWNYKDKLNEFQCQTEKREKKLNSFCLSYRGKYFEQELKRTQAGLLAIGGADYLMWDCELLSTSLSNSINCPRCQERKSKGDYGNKPFGEAMAYEIFLELNSGIRKTAKQAKLQSPLIGMYNVDAARIYSRAFQIKEEEIFDFQNPSLYVNKTKVVNEHLRKCEINAPNVPIVPWLTVNTYGYVTPINSKIIVWEAFMNGSKGITYYQFEDFNPAHYVEICKALSAIAPVEKIVYYGKPAHNEFTVDNDEVRISARRLNNEVLLLLVNQSEKETKVKWSHKDGASDTMLIPAQDGVLLRTVL